VVDSHVGEECGVKKERTVQAYKVATHHEIFEGSSAGTGGGGGYIDG